MGSGSLGRSNPFGASQRVKPQTEQAGLRLDKALSPKSRETVFSSSGIQVGPVNENKTSQDLAASAELTFTFGGFRLLALGAATFKIQGDKIRSAALKLGRKEPRKNSFIEGSTTGHGSPCDWVNEPKSEVEWYLPIEKGYAAETEGK